MTAKDLFGVIVRAMGLFIFVLGVLVFVSDLIKLITATFPVPNGGASLLLAIILIVTGLYFLFGANWITGVVYKNSQN